MRRLFEGTLVKLRVRQFRLGGSARMTDSDLLVSPRGHRDERTLDFERDEGAVCVCTPARHSEGSYEKLLDGGVQQGATPISNPGPV